MSESTPNIVFIHAESMDGRLMGCAGHPAMQRATPNLDRLAETGVRFTNAYSNCPVCNPSRASMWTGQYPNHYDCWNNHEGIRSDVPTLFDAFDRAGYRTFPIGPIDYGYGMHSIRDRVGSWTRAAGIMRPTSRTPLPEVSDDIDFFKKDRAWTDEAVAAIESAGQSEQPFFLYLTTGLVHPAFQAHTRHMDLIDADHIEIPPTLSDLEATTHPAIRYARVTKHCENRFSDSTVREMRHVYFAMVAALDELVGRVVDAVSDAGRADSTYIVFSSDHGEMAGEQNMVLKRTMFEPSVHVPLIVCGPDVLSGKTVEDPVSLVDLYPTFLEMAGVDYAAVATDAFPDRPVGESIVPQVRELAPRSRDWAFSEYHGDRCLTGTYMLRRGRYKYIRHEGAPSQLFDIEADPWETRDLADEEPRVAAELDDVLTTNFDCTGIDARAKRYDRESFLAWREKAREAGEYEETMSRVYSGFDRLCIEDIVPWRDEDERLIESWLDSSDQT